MLAHRQPICFINIDASGSVKVLREQRLKDIQLLPSVSSQSQFACTSKHVYTQAKKKKNNNNTQKQAASSLLHKSHTYNAHHIPCVPPC